MSLKTFHIVFIAVSICLTIGFGVWAIRDYASSHDRTILAMGIASDAGAIALGLYGAWFLKKLRGFSYV